MNALQQVSSPMYLTPAYGRRYRTEQAMLTGWMEGKDFTIGRLGPCTSVRDLELLVEDCSSLWLVQVNPELRLRLK
jgi:hypothetical protein